MIPTAQITEWRRHAPWANDDDVEQDLVISRALIELFRVQFLRDRLAFRGGTALHKLVLAPATRYSEDIDLVLLVDEPLGPILDAVRDALAWINPKPTRDRGFNLTMKFGFETAAGTPRKLKVEANRGEHFSAPRVVEVAYSVDSPFFKGDTRIRTYALEELLSTKFRALYQRSKGRDLYDLWYAAQQKQVAFDQVYALFTEYWKNDGKETLRRDAVRQNMDAKHARGVFADVRPLLRTGTAYDPDTAYAWFDATLLPLFPA